MCGATVLEVEGEKFQILEWPGYGFRLEVPDGALSEGKRVSVGVKAIVSGNFLLPKDTLLISAIYRITASEEFQKKVAVIIQHCAVVKSEEEFSKLRFIIAKCSQKPPYKFRVLDGEFDAHFATIKLKRFSYMGVVAPTETDVRFNALKFYQKVPNTTVEVNFKFVVVHNHPVLVKVVDIKFIIQCSY